MKKVIIIGNGFDLAHGLKTSFPDFANYFIESVITPNIARIINDHSYKFPLFQRDFISKLRGIYSVTIPNPTTHQFMWLRTKENKLNDVSERLKAHPTLIREIINNKFLSNLYSASYLNWFDIEHAYFHEAKRIREDYFTAKNLNFSDNILKIIKDHNDEFEFIKNEFIKYLESIELQKNSDIERFIKSQFRGGHDPIEIVNFNYTNTIEFYLSFIGGTGLTSIHNVHGQLQTDSIIFGYGNDQHESYKAMKDIGVDEFLKNFKTYLYFQNHVYQNLISAIRDGNEFEVMVLGHSLGQSDRTLLQEIMNPKLCKKVTIYKRKDLSNQPDFVRAEYNKLIYAASRIFEEDGEMRVIVSNFDNSPYFPNKITRQKE